MRAVLDVNVALKTAIPEPDSALAFAFIGDYLAGHHELLAPDTLLVEAAHALTRAVRRGIISGAQAKLASIMSNSPALHRYRPLLPRAVELSLQMRHGVYDCLYVALAEREGCSVVTADQRMVNTFQLLYPFVIHLSTV
jgi:predicted nucleic acid-binding protein